MPPSAFAGNGWAVGAAALVLLVGLVMTMDVLGSLYSTVLESKGPVLLVVLGLLATLHTMADGGLPVPGAPWSGRQQQAPGGGPGNGGGDANSLSQPEQQQPEGRQGPRGNGRQPSSGGVAPEPAPPRRASSLGQLGPAFRSSSGVVSASSSASALAVAGGKPASSSTALVPADDNGLALIETTSLRCPKPSGCGFRHACPDLGRSWMACGQCGRHPAPPPGSVWREEVAGRHALLLSWEGRVLDVTAVGECRGWNRQMNEAVRVVLSTGRRPSAMCSRSPRYPMLDKAVEVCAMDYRAAARGRKLWGMFGQWLRQKQQGQQQQQPLALEMGQVG